MNTRVRKSSHWALSVAAVGLVTALGCSSTKPCNPNTVLVSVTFDSKTSPADTIDVDVSIDGAAPTTTSLAHTPGAASGSVEVYFPNGSGYPVGKRIDVTVVASKGATQLGTATYSVASLPAGCGTLTVKFTGPGADGGAGSNASDGAAGSAPDDGAAGTSGDATGAAGTAGPDGGTGTGAAGTSADGGTDTTPPLCVEAATRSCAVGGSLGACAKGTQTCTGAKWGACSILPAAADLCDTKGDDSNCNGTANDGCACAPGDARLCSAAGAMGNCAKGAESCVDGKWGPCSILPAAADSCSVKGDDANCNGTPNDICLCLTTDAPRACSADGAKGNCAAGTETCSTAGKWSACSVAAAATDSCSVKGDDANCNGTPNDTCLCLTTDAPRLCSVDGAKGNCAAGKESCTTAGKWGACSVVAAAADSCTIKGDDANCNGQANDACPCVSGDTQPCGPAAVGICKPGVATCTNGVWGACQGAVNKAARDCTSAADNDCDGKADNTIDLVCKCASGGSQACGAHPGNDGHGPCHAGTQACVVAADKTSSTFGACGGSVGPAAADTCVQGNDDNCTGTVNDACNCINGVTTQACGYCKNGSQTCADGKANTYTACVGATGQDFTALTLTNGWATYSTGMTPAVALDCNNTVSFKGALASGTGVAFTLPAGLRPAANVWTPVDMINGAKGRILVQSTGDVQMQAASGNSTDAPGFTSLESVSFPLSTSGYTPLTLLNGWTTTTFTTRVPAISLAGGIVRFEGAMSTTGAISAPFTVPVGFRPSTTVYLNVDMFNAAQGRIQINTDGTVSVQALGDSTTATKFTSLEGAWYATSTAGFTALSLVNGWTNTPYGTAAPAVSVSNGIVRFQGAMSNDPGASLAPFTLPVGFRPAATVYMPVDLCGANVGRLIISPSGSVSIYEAAGGTDAYCFTSLDGDFFGL